MISHRMPFEGFRSTLGHYHLNKKNLIASLLNNDRRHCSLTGSVDMLSVSIEYFCSILVTICADSYL